MDEGRELAFSAVATIDDDGTPVATRRMRASCASASPSWRRAPTMLHVLVRHNAAVSTGNLVFRRRLLERTGGFAALRVCHDWDFVLAASRATRFAFVDEPLYAYRLHGANTFSGLTLAGRLEGELVLDRFLCDVDSHPWLAGDRSRGVPRLPARGRPRGLPRVTFAPPASRNAPCPCGSGRRYKECHGALAVPASQVEPLEALLQRALAAHQSGALDLAASLYDQALAREPLHFDALHMRGVVELQAGRLEPALALIERAVALRPDIASALQNLGLVRAALQRAGFEERYAQWIDTHRARPHPGARAGASRGGRSSRRAALLDRDADLRVARGSPGREPRERPRPGMASLGTVHRRRRVPVAARAAQVLESYAERDPRVRVTCRADNGHISEASNTALAMAGAPVRRAGGPRRRAGAPRAGGDGPRAPRASRCRHRLQRRGQARRARTPGRALLQARLEPGADRRRELREPSRRVPDGAGACGRRLPPRCRGRAGLGPAAPVLGARPARPPSATCRRSSTTGA